MSDELMQFDSHEHTSHIIKVFGVGGGGSNAVNHMYRQGIKDVGFVVCNTDAQALANSPVPTCIQIGDILTEGRGAGNKPEKGREAALENLNDIVQELTNNVKMIFITAGMGGGTGTGAAPIIAKAAKDLDILTVAIVTIPFRFEGQRRINQAIEGIRELRQHVDSLIVINNEKLREVSGDLTISNAFGKADDVLTTAARGIAEIITVHGHLNVDFADVQTVMSNSGVALMGSAQAEGTDRAIKAIQTALNSPLLNNNDIRGAKNILLNISSGDEEVTMDEISEINEFVQEAAGYSADLIWGNSHDPNLGSKIGVTVIATGFETDVIPEFGTHKGKEKTVVDLATGTTTVRNSEQTVFEVFKDQKEFKLAEEERKSPTQVRQISQPEPQKEVKRQSNEELNLDELDDDVRKALERLRSLRNSHAEEDRRGSYLENIDELENTPAYKRKKIVLNDDDSDVKSPISRYSLNEETGNTRLRPNNSFLHDNVD
jgi:cell division protein FtsZ